MSNFQIDFRPQLVDPTAFIAENAVVLGDVTIGAEASVWFNAVVRGDTSPIQIGPGSNVQDSCVLHADPGFPCEIGENVTIGHAAVVHGATIEDNVLIGLRAVVLNGARVRSGSVIAAGAIVTEGVEIPPHSLVMGVPGKVVRETTEQHLAQIRHAAEHYKIASRKYNSRLES
ncbi:MAG: gamma carbonic anhydrase family protein [Pirellulaceae bacterium]|nr:gamma carbonic anhydrase family protein [Pirellulaceae bacterium]